MKKLIVYCSTHPTQPTTKMSEIKFSTFVQQPTVIKNIINIFLSDQDRSNLVHAFNYKSRDAIFWCLKIRNTNFCPPVMMQICGFGVFNTKSFYDFVTKISESEIMNFIAYKNVEALTIIGKYQLFKPSNIAYILLGSSNKLPMIDQEFVKKASIQLRIVIFVNKQGMYFDYDKEFAMQCIDSSIPRSSMFRILAKKQNALKRQYAKMF
jgi:hypothetical protein